MLQQFNRKTAGETHQFNISAANASELKKLAALAIEWGAIDETNGTKRIETQCKILSPVFQPRRDRIKLSERSIRIRKKKTTPLKKKQEPIVKIDQTLDLESLTAQQRSVLEALKCSKNVFFTGSGGTGKSYLIKCIQQMLRKQDGIYLTATTQISAHLVGGMTVHNYAGIFASKLTLEQHIANLQRNPAALAR